MREAGYEVAGLRRGWASLLNILPSGDAESSEWVLPLTRENTRTIDRSGGTILHTSRLNPALTRPEAIPEHLRAEAPPPGPDGKVDLTACALRTLERLRLDVLVAIGGDGTLSFARRLHEEGVRILGVPKTMDNDVFGTDYCIGFSTAVTRSVNFIDDLRTAAGSHERFLVVELFGRYSGETCLLSSYLAGVDRALLAEVPFDTEAVVTLLAGDKRSNPSNYAVASISEGAYPVGMKPFEAGKADAVGHRELGGVGRRLREALRGEDRREGHLPAPRLPHALRAAGFPRPSGGQQLREPGSRPDPRRREPGVWWPSAPDAMPRSPSRSPAKARSRSTSSGSTTATNTVRRSRA